MQIGRLYRCEGDGYVLKRGLVEVYLSKHGGKKKTCFLKEGSVGVFNYKQLATHLGTDGILLVLYNFINMCQSLYVWMFFSQSHKKGEWIQMKFGTQIVYNLDNTIGYIESRNANEVAGKS